MLGDHSYRFLTVDEMKSLGDDSMPIDDKMDVSFQSTTMAGKTSSLFSLSLSPSLSSKIPSDLISVTPHTNTNFHSFITTNCSTYGVFVTKNSLFSQCFPI